MNCGFCKEPDVNVAHVKSCAAQRGIPTEEGAAPAFEPKFRPVRPSEERREEMRRDLLRQVREVSARVDEGHYAVTGEDGDLKFYVVQKGKDGTKWAGRTFLSVQASDELHRLKGLSKELAVYNKILANPQEAMLRYGREIGRCGHCHRTLTNAQSRERGIGPVCAGHMGWTDLAKV